MRLLAEERRLGTLELLLTYPVTDRVVVMAKLGACLLVVAMLLACTLVYPFAVWRVQEFPLAPLAAGYLGLLLLGSMCAAYGLFVSSMTDSQVPPALDGDAVALLLAARGTRRRTPPAPRLCAGQWSPSSITSSPSRWVSSTCATSSTSYSGGCFVWGTLRC
jgi:ABC-2 type transport system permease protein